MPSIAELRLPAFAFHWDEAVAVVSEIASLLVDRRRSTVPAPEHIELSDDGTLRLLDDGPPDAAPGRRLARMLDVMLESIACPPELRQLIADTMADPSAYPTIEAFANALAFFERPGRRELLAAVAARASELAAEAVTDTELERLEARARNQPRDPEHRPKPTKPMPVRRIVVLSGGLVVVFMLAAGSVMTFQHPSEARAMISERVLQHVDRIAQKGLEVMGVRTPAPPASQPPAPIEVPRVARKPARHTPPAIPIVLPVKELIGGHLSALPPAAASKSPEPLVVDDTVYTSAAPNVEPAVLLRPQLPSRAPSAVPANDLGVLEIIVGPTGAVERVRLISVANRYHDRMIVAAAKAWVFEPAIKDGRPVRYRIEIPVTL